ncbi:PREDICTED: disease resistance-like protein CSA1 [Camelina sativa]|uniref:Disease resistance-like protein CSA1 n=1 Tax=Camelina sativa TaxID=90675 RepID=A0ABM0Y2V9_CAMSA|nr:PREDICTED: disease resistance-like protein CSA1 [Camelina sativa]
MQVFFNFRGAELRNSVVAHLAKALKENGVKAAYVDAGDSKNPIFYEMEESRVAIVIFSRRYTESVWCLQELVKIKERVELGKLVAIPVYYKLDPSEVKELEGDFGLNLWNDIKRTSEFGKLEKWKGALDFFSQMRGLVFNEKSNERDFVTSTTKHLINVLSRISVEQTEKPRNWLSDQKHGDAFMNSSRSDNLKVVDVEEDSILCDTKSDGNSKEVESIQPEAKSRKGDDFLGEANFDATFNLQNCVENERVGDPISEGKKEENVSESSTTVSYHKPQPERKVFINFRGDDLRYGFVGHLVTALKMDGVNVDVYTNETRGKDLGSLFEMIEESQIALVILSSKYTESHWCLNELVKIKQLMEEGKLVVVPIFYKLESSEVKQLKGDFGANFWNLWRISRDDHIIKWKEALEHVASMNGIIYSNEHSSESEFITISVKKVLEIISLQEGESTELSTERGETHKNYLNKQHLVGVEQRITQLEEKLEFDSNKTRIVGVVGMPGIGKTTLAMTLHEKWNCRFLHCVPLLDIRKKSEDYGSVWLRKTLLEVLLEGKFPEISDKTTHESMKDKLLQNKVFIVLDDVSDKTQLEFLLGDLDWIKKGSKIVITTSD